MKGKIYQLRFQHILPTSRLVISYFLKKNTPQKQRETNYLYLQVFAGTHLLKRVQVSTVDPWKKQEIPLGVLPFLNREVMFTFEVSPDEADGLTFAMVPELYP